MTSDKEEDTLFHFLSFKANICVGLFEDDDFLDCNKPAVYIISWEDNGNDGGSDILCKSCYNKAWNDMKRIAKDAGLKLKAKKINENH